MEPMKQINLRIPQDKKRQLTLALINQGVSFQNLFEAFADQFVSYDKKEMPNRDAETVSRIVKRAQTLREEILKK